jgi:hypothetical protein
MSEGGVQVDEASGHLPARIDARGKRLELGLRSRLGRVSGGSGPSSPANRRGCRSGCLESARTSCGCRVPTSSYPAGTSMQASPASGKAGDARKARSGPAESADAGGCRGLPMPGGYRFRLRGRACLRRAGWAPRGVAAVWGRARGGGLRGVPCERQRLSPFDFPGRSRT